jgi:LysR family transcriptional activator of glutamate synthase operon
MNGNVIVMETDALRWFQLVADGVTVTEIGEIERITQSGVSRALARLETDVGTPLLSRSGRVLRLTHAGSVFKAHVDVLLHELDDALAAVDELVDPESGTVTLAFHLSLGTWLVPDLVSSFRTEHPQVQFVLKPLRDELGPTASPFAPVDLEITTLRPRDSKVRLLDAAEEQFVMLRPTSLFRQLCEDLCRTAGFHPQIAFEGDDIPTVRGFVAAGLGVAIVPALRENSPDAATGALHHLPITDVGAVRQIGMVWSSTRRLLPTAELFRDHVIARASARALPALAEGG